MIPQKIYRDNLKDLNLTDKEHKEVVDIIKTGEKTCGFRYQVSGGKCVAIGKRLNKFSEYAKVASLIMSKAANVSRFRFILVSD